jgi:hypothetical protein
LAFFLPAAIHLLGERRLRDLGFLLSVGPALSAVALGAADWLYWGTPFHSLANVYRFTLVERLSSRGYQPLIHYLWPASEWIAYPILALAIGAVAIGDKRPAAWVGGPLVALSLLPHKEARYLVAVHPFACLAATTAVVAIVDRLDRARAERRRWGAASLVAALSVSLLFEVTNWRFRRSDDEVELARVIAATNPSAVAAPQLWRFGGHLFWRNVPRLIDLTSVSETELRRVVVDSPPDWLILPRSQFTVEVSALLAAEEYREHSPGGAVEYRVFRKAAVTQRTVVLGATPGHFGNPGIARP